MKITAAEMTNSQKRRFFIGILMFFMLAGVIAGVVFVISETGRNYVHSSILNQGLVKYGDKKTFVEILLNSFFPLELIFLTQMLCGFFAVGQPLCLFTLFHRGAAGGISASLIYSIYGVKGFFVILIMLLPTFLADMYILVLGARESIKQSNILFGFAVKGNTEPKIEIKVYFVKFLVLTAFAIAFSLFDSILTYFFSDILL